MKRSLFFGTHNFPKSSVPEQKGTEDPIGQDYQSSCKSYQGSQPHVQSFPVLHCYSSLNYVQSLLRSWREKNTDLIVQQTHAFVVDGIPDQGILVVVAFHFEQVYDLIALVLLLFLLVTYICCI